MLTHVVPGQAITAGLLNRIIDEINAARNLSVDGTMRMVRHRFGTALGSRGGAGGVPHFYGTLDNNLYNSAEGVYVTILNDNNGDPLWFVDDPGTAPVFVYNIPQTIDTGAYLFKGKPAADCLCIYSKDNDKWYFDWVQCSDETPLQPPGLAA